MNVSKVTNLPNFLSFLRIALTPFFLVCVFSEGWYWNLIAFVVFTLASITDYFDGKLARKNDEITTLGHFLDPLADKILVTSALIAFALNRLVVWWLIVPIIVRDIYVTAMRLRSIHKGGVMTTSRLAKWKTAIQLIVVIALLALYSFYNKAKYSADPKDFGYDLEISDEEEEIIDDLSLEEIQVEVEEEDDLELLDELENL